MPVCFSENASYLTPDRISEATYSPSALSEEYPPKIHSTEVKGNSMRNLFLPNFTQEGANTAKIVAQDDVRDPQMWTRSFSVTTIVGSRTVPGLVNM